MTPAHAVVEHRLPDDMLCDWSCPCLPVRFGCPVPDCQCVSIVHGFDRVARVSRAEGGHP